MTMTTKANLMRHCYTLAEQSTHPTSHLGALLIKENNIILEGVNNFPPGVAQTPERVAGENRHIYPNHAERFLIYEAARRGIATEGASIVVPWPPCVTCAGALITSGIKKIVLHKQITEAMPKEKQLRDREGLILLEEAEVKIEWVDEVLGVQAYRSRRYWQV